MTDRRVQPGLKIWMKILKPLNKHPISCGLVSLSLVSSPSKTAKCDIELIINTTSPLEEHLKRHIAGPKAKISQSYLNGSTTYQWNGDVVKSKRTGLKKISISVSLNEMDADFGSELHDLLSHHVPALKLPSHKRSTAAASIDALHRILIDYSRYENLPQASLLIAKYKRPEVMAPIDSEISSELPCMPSSVPDQVPLASSSSSDIPFLPCMP